MRREESRRRPQFEAALFAAALLAGLAASCRREATPPVSRTAGEPVELEAAPQSAARAQESGYLFTAAEKAAVDDFLRRHPDLRVATDRDRRGTRGGDGDVRGLYGIYHPYFVRGDLNDDGVLDFVLAFVQRSSGRGTPWFSVVVFAGLGENRGFSSGMFIERDISLTRGDVSIDRDAILVSPDLSDDAVRRYRWDPVHRSYVFVRDEDEPDEAPRGTQT